MRDRAGPTGPISSANEGGESITPSYAAVVNILQLGIHLDRTDLKRTNACDVSAGRPMSFSRRCSGAGMVGLPILIM
jgi:hypothetical protein